MCVFIWLIYDFNSLNQVLVPIANDSEEMEALSIIDVLRRAKATVTIASVEETLEVSARRKVKIVADILIDAAAKFQYDLIVLPVSEILYLNEIILKL